MATIALSPPNRALPYLLTTPRARLRAWGVPGVAAVLVISAVAVGIRVWNIGAVMATSDQVAMAWLVRHSFGFKWIFAHDYGPVLPLVQRTWAELLWRVHLPVEEAAMRIPIAVASLLQVWLTYGLVRRLGRERTEAGLAAMTCALLPALVSDAHYAWGYGTLWLLTGTIALWAFLSYFDEDRPGWLLLGGTALLLHCLGNCFAFALPVALMYLWSTRVVRGGKALACASGSEYQAGGSPNGTTLTCAFNSDGGTGVSRSDHGSVPLMRSFIVGFVMPCCLALVVIVLSWWWTGGGQLGRLAFKHSAGSTGLQIDQIFELPGMWVAHFGYLFAVPVAIGLAWATLRSRDRVLAVWCWASLLPMLLLVDWDRVGYAAEYLIEAAYAAGLLGTLWICAVIERLAHRPQARVAFGCVAAIALLHMGVGAADGCLNHAGLARWTGLGVSWGSVRPETGIQAAGWYVRKHVPSDAVVMTTHTNTGMEVTVAEYYCGRKVLADCDLRPEMVEPLVQTMHSSVDVLIVDAASRHLTDSLAGFEQTAVFRHDGQPVRYVYARPALALPRMDEEAQTLNAFYDRECRCEKVPQALPAPADFHSILERYQQIVRSLRTGAGA